MVEQMKPSGIDWIGDIPQSWTTTRLKYHIECLDGKRIPIDAALRESGDYPYWGAGSIVDYVNDYIFDEEIVLLGEDGAPFFDDYRPVSFLVREKVWVNNHIHVLKGKSSILNNYLVYFLNSVKYDVYINGSILNKLTQSNMNEIALVLPSIIEQNAIADFLDKRCGKIDSIISDLEKQIGTLQKYKKSLILETVTKGLNKTVPMKASGIDWIGNIPAHWDIKPLKYLFELYAGGDIEDYNVSEDKTETYKYPIYSNSLENAGLFGYTNKYRFSGHTITVTGRGEVGHALPRYDNYYPIVRLLVGVPKQSLNVEYYANSINSTSILGEQTAMAQLTTQKLGIIKVPVPPFEEQENIGKFLKENNNRINRVIELKKEQLEKIKQHKKSLIYEYVTGKKRVKEAINGN